MQNLSVASTESFLLYLLHMHTFLSMSKEKLSVLIQGVINDFFRYITSVSRFFERTLHLFVKLILVFKISPTSLLCYKVCNKKVKSI